MPHDSNGQTAVSLNSPPLQLLGMIDEYRSRDRIISETIINKGFHEDNVDTKKQRIYTFEIDK